MKKLLSNRVFLSCFNSKGCKALFVFTSVTFLFFPSCKKDFNVNAKWKEIMVIYGLLDPSQPVQYIKINKSFLGDGNAYNMAQSPDSFVYKPGQIEARLERWTPSGSMAESILLVRDSSIAKSTGTFANSPNILYTTTNPIRQDGSTYKINVKKLLNGTTANASTPIVGTIKFNKPSLIQTVDWIATYQSPKFQFLIQWEPTPNGKIYQLILRFHFTEVNASNSNDSLVTYADWVFTQKTSADLCSGPYLCEKVYGKDFYQFLVGAIPKKDNVIRYPGKLEFVMLMGAEELYNYSEVNKPSSSIVQDKPVYTNINNGVGIFSCRYTQDNSCPFSPLLKLTGPSLTELYTPSSATADLAVGILALKFQPR